MPAEVQALLQWVISASGTAVGAAFVWMVYTGRLVIRREIEREREVTALYKYWSDFWREKCIEAWQTTNRATDTTGKAVETVEHIVKDDKRVRK